MLPHRRSTGLLVASLLLVGVPSLLAVQLVGWRPIARAVLLWSGSGWAAVAAILAGIGALSFAAGWWAGRRRGYRRGFQAGHRSYRVGGPY